MRRTINTWYLSSGKSGFQLHICEESYWKSLLADVLELTDMGWWGKYKNIPFCWINPWSWTYKLGSEDNNLGYLWHSVGNRVLNYIDDLRNSRELKCITIADDEVKTAFPDLWDWHTSWKDD